MRKLLLACASMALMATGAEAHVGQGHAEGFAHGFMHPLGGADHLLAMVAVGLFAAVMGGRARWAVPLTFVAMLVAGGVWGMAGMGLPFVELGILLSVLVFAVLISLELKLPVLAAVALAGGFAAFHGVAHGAEMPADTSGLAYAVGFATATAVLHAAGFGFGLAAARWARLGGVAIALAGAGLALGWG